MRTPGGFHVDAPAEGERGTPTGRRGLRSSSGRGVALGIVGSPVGRSPGCPADAGRGREGTGASADVPIGRIRFTGEPCIPRPRSRRRVGVCHRLRPLADEGVGSGALRTFGLQGDRRLSLREQNPERSLGEEADSQLAQPVGLLRLRLRAAPPSAH